MERSTTLLSSSTRPSSRNRVGPARERVADRLGELGLLADRGELGAQPGLQRLDHRQGPVLTGGATGIGLKAPDLGLHGVERLDAIEGLAGDRRGAGGGQLVEAPADMGPAEGELDLALLRQRTVSSSGGRTRRRAASSRRREASSR